MRAPPRREIVHWILKAWDNLDRGLIIRSFRSCALTVASDGHEDNQIHCLKEVQPCHAGLDRLTSIQQALSGSLATNPFAHVRMSHIEKAAPRNFKSLIDLSNNEIEIEIE